MLFSDSPYFLRFWILNNKLTFPDGESFYLDVKDGERGYNSDPARGADTFRPFKIPLQKIHLGNGTSNSARTFSAKSIKGYKKLTNANFAIVATGASCFNYGGTGGVWIIIVILRSSKWYCYCKSICCILLLCRQASVLVCRLCSICICLNRIKPPE